MTLSANEQYLLELINRARLDPLGEAARYGIDLNENLAPGTIDGSQKQPLAANAILNTAAEGHSSWMLANNEFDHIGVGGSTPAVRIADAGYVFSPPAVGTGENISRVGTTGTLNLLDAIEQQHEGLFLSEGHRENLMNDAFREVGLAQVQGDFTSPQGTFDTSMLTQKFAFSGTESFLTGVAFNDTDNDGFYTAGEGLMGVTFQIGNASDVTSSSGGYSVGVAPAANLVVAIVSGLFDATVLVSLDSGNVKLDLVDEEKLLSSGDLTLLSGVTKAELIGTDDTSLTGTTDNDDLTGNSGSNTIDGLSGEDTLRGGLGDDTLNGGADADFVVGGDGSDDIDGGAGDDTLEGGAQEDSLTGGEGADTLEGGGGFDTLEGGLGDDSLDGGAQADRIFGGGGRDTAFGGAGTDDIYGGTEGDVIVGGEDNDRLFGEEGNDTLFGGTQEDRLFGGADNDRLFGEGGFDRLEGGAGRDYLDGGAQADNLFGQAGNDTLLGGDGFDRLFGGEGDDLLEAQNGSDALFGEAGNDTLRGGQDDDRFFAGSGDDLLEGGEGNDILRGNAGFDTLDGGVGNDTLEGNFNADTFVFADGHGQDTISDFEATNLFEQIDFSQIGFGPGITDYDSLELSGAVATVTGGVRIDTGGGNEVFLQGVQIGDLDNGDFIF